jgi:hypothetical protein
VEHKEEGEGGGDHHQGIGEDVEGESGCPPQAGVGGPLRILVKLFLLYIFFKLKNNSNHPQITRIPLNVLLRNMFCSLNFCPVQAKNII